MLHFIYTSILVMCWTLDVAVDHMTWSSPGSREIITYDVNNMSMRCLLRYGHISYCGRVVVGQCSNISKYHSWEQNIVA